MDDGLDEDNGSEDNGSDKETASSNVSAPGPNLPAPVTVPEWKPLNANQRRVLGTLMEKSKTTPDAYPMSYTGLATGCNQKNNRDPLSSLTVDQVETIVDELRALGAAAIVQGSGRVTKVRHYAYNWLGLSKIEAAVMTELLLRGAQTMGELRTRASRMEPISDISVLQEIFDELKRRGLAVALTPAGRGQVVSHNLYPEWELEKLKNAKWETSVESGPTGAVGSGVSSGKVDGAGIAVLQAEIKELKETVHSLMERLTRLEKDLGVS